MDASNQDYSEAPFAEYLRALYVNRPADLIVSLGGLRSHLSSDTDSNSFRPAR